VSGFSASLPADLKESHNSIEDHDRKNFPVSFRLRSRNVWNRLEIPKYWKNAEIVTMGNKKGPFR